jgi:group I intron endonuclease
MSTIDDRPCFIYAIVHQKSGRRYVGSCLYPKRRWIVHRSKLKHQKHHCSHLQRAWNKYGPDSFSFTILKTLPSNDSRERALAELEAIAAAECFNSRIANLGLTNFENNAETREKINKGISKRLSEDENLREWLKNRGAELAAYARTPQRRAIRSELSKILWTNPDHRKLIKGKLDEHWSQSGVREEHSERVKKHRTTPEAREQMSAIMQAKWADPSSGLRNRKQTRWADPEAKKRQSEKMKAIHAARRTKLRP